MIESIEINNFKSIITQKINLKPLTLLAGLNNTGKSSVIQAIRMFYKWDIFGDPTLSNHGPLNEMKNIKVGKQEAIQIKISVDNEIETLIINFDEEKQPKILPKKLRKKLPILTYISADRWGPRISLPIYTSYDSLTHVGEFGEYVLDYLSRYEDLIVPQFLLHEKSEGETLQFTVRGWLTEISPNVKFRHATDIKRDLSYAEINEFRPHNTGFGLSYTLPIIVSLLGTNSILKSEKQKNDNYITLIENPEAHLHPMGQTSIGKLIARSASNNHQVIIETHSDHLMDGIRLAIKNKDIKNSDVAFLYFSLNDDKDTQVEEILINEKGKLNNWPEGFFDQSIKNRSLLARND